VTTDGGARSLSGFLKREAHEDHRSFTAKTAKNAKNIAKGTEFLTHRSISSQDQCNLAMLSPTTITEPRC